MNTITNTIDRVSQENRISLRSTSERDYGCNNSGFALHSLCESYIGSKIYIPSRTSFSQPLIRNSINDEHARHRRDNRENQRRADPFWGTGKSTVLRTYHVESPKRIDVDYCKRLYIRLRKKCIAANTRAFFSSNCIEDSLYPGSLTLTIDKTKAIQEAEQREEAENEWNQVPTIVGKVSDEAPLNSAPVTVDQAVLHFKQLDLPKENEKPPQEKNKFSDVFRWFKFPVLTDDLAKEFEFITSLTKCGLNWSDKVQCRILQTIYKKLTGAKIDCPQRGTHWQLIGFQGNDPATDLRSVGLFGLLQFLHLTSDKLLPLAHKVYKVANSENQPFPLAVLSLNLTNIVLNVFNTGRLNRECIARKSVLDTLNSFYSALMVYTFNIWVTQKKTIKDSGYLLKDAERYCARNVKKVLRDLPKNLHKYDQ